MMQYHLKSKTSRVGFWKNVIAFSIFSLLILFSFFFSNVAQTVLYTISKPLWLIYNNVTGTSNNIKNFFVTKNSLISQNNFLQDEVARLRLKDIDYDTVLKENETLKNQTAILDGGTRIISRILSKPPQSAYDTFVIDFGSSDGLAPGDRVYVSDTIIVGSVVSVSPHSSLVSLFSTSGQKQSATNLRTGATFELTGKGGANFQIEVPKDSDILQGDTFLYPTKSTSVIGNVYFIDSNSQSSFKKIYLRIPGNVFSTQWVFVQKSQ